MKTSVIGLPFVATLVVLALVAAVVAWVPVPLPVAVRLVRGHPRRRRVLRLLTPVLALVAAAAIVNEYFAYLPNVGSILGVRAFDQASSAQVDLRAQRASAPSSSVPVTAARHGVVELVHIPGVRSGFHARAAQVYLPPAYFDVPRPALPVIELLHGTPGTPEDWTRAGSADVAADRYAAGHDGRAPILVMPDPNGGWSRDTECVDGLQGRAETYLTQDVPAWVETTLGASTDRRRWALEGSSEGGYCALDLALRHRDRYATFVDIAGMDRATYPGGALRLFGNDGRALAAHDPRRLLEAWPPGPPMAAWFTAGSADGLVTRSVKSVADRARAAGIEVHVELVPGAHHTWRVFRHGFATSLPWVAARLGLDRPEVAPPAT